MTKVLIIIALAIAVIVFGPLASLWALNTLFPTLAIPYTLDTWMASFLLGALVSGNTGISTTRK